MRERLDGEIERERKTKTIDLFESCRGENDLQANSKQNVLENEKKHKFIVLALSPYSKSSRPQLENGCTVNVASYAWSPVPKPG